MTIIGYTQLVEITDETNQAKAIGFIPATWGIGMCLGPVLGGTLEHPANKYPAFSHPLWKEYPYFLPCLVAACFSLVSLLLGVVFLEEVGHCVSHIDLLTLSPRA